MKRFQLLPVESPYVELECGGTVVKSENIQKVSRNPNFPDPVVTFDVVCDMCVWVVYGSVVCVMWGGVKPTLN